MKPYTTLISAAQLQTLLESPQSVRIFDCTSALMDPLLADTQYAERHIAGAVQAHLDRDLSAKPPQPAVNGGRHPLPQPEQLAQWLGRGSGFAVHGADARGADCRRDAGGAGAGGRSRQYAQAIRSADWALSGGATATGGFCRRNLCRFSSRCCGRAGCGSAWLGGSSV